MSLFYQQGDLLNHFFKDKALKLLILIVRLFLIRCQHGIKFLPFSFVNNLFPLRRQLFLRQPLVFHFYYHFVFSGTNRYFNCWLMYNVHGFTCIMHKLIHMSNIYSMSQMIHELKVLQSQGCKRYEHACELKCKARRKRFGRI